MQRSYEPWQTHSVSQVTDLSSRQQERSLPQMQNSTKHPARWRSRWWYWHGSPGVWSGSCVLLPGEKTPGAALRVWQRRNGETFKMPCCRDEFKSSYRFHTLFQLVTWNLSCCCLLQSLIGWQNKPAGWSCLALVCKSCLLGFGAPLQGAKLKISSF